MRRRWQSAARDSPARDRQFEGFFHLDDIPPIFCDLVLDLLVLRRTVLTAKFWATSGLVRRAKLCVHSCRLRRRWRRRTWRLTDMTDARLRSSRCTSAAVHRANPITTRLALNPASRFMSTTALARAKCTRVVRVCHCGRTRFESGAAEVVKSNSAFSSLDNFGKKRIDWNPFLCALCAKSLIVN